MTTAPLTDAPHTETTRVSAVSAATAGYSIDIASGLDGCTTVRLAGDFEMNSRAELTDVLGQALRIGTRVDVDASAVTFLYSGAAHTIIDAAENAAGNGHCVRVTAANRASSKIFHILGAAHLLDEQP